MTHLLVVVMEESKNPSQECLHKSPVCAESGVVEAGLGPASIPTVASLSFSKVLILLSNREKNVKLDG